MIHHEDNEQKALFQRLAWEYPDLLAFHIPNGGKRGRHEASRLKAQGVKPGIPDICIPVARNGFHGLYIELKRAFTDKQNKPYPTKEQKEMLERLNTEGYRAIICYGADEAFEAIEYYLHPPRWVKKVGNKYEEINKLPDYHSGESVTYTSTDPTAFSKLKKLINKDEDIT